MTVAASVGHQSSKLRAISARVTFYTGLLAISDVAAMFVALLLAFEMRSLNSARFAFPVSFAHFAALALLVAPSWIVFFGALGLYTRERRRVSGQVGRILLGVLCGVASLVVVDYFHLTSTIYPARSVPVYAFLFGAILTITFRGLLRFAIHVGYSRGYAVHRVVVLGAGPIANRVTASMTQPGSGYEVVAIVSPEHDGGHFSRRSIPIYRSFDAAIRAIEHPIDEIVQADLDIKRDDVAQLITWARANNVAYRFVPDLFGVYAAASRLQMVDGLPVMQVRETSLEGWHSVVKRGFDLAAAGLLLLLLAPLYLVVAAAVKLRDPSGPVFYRQARVGHHGKVIRVLKFRSMLWKYSTGPGRPYADACEAFRAMGRDDLCDEFSRDHKVQDDPRISAVGRVLRRTSLDELPQLLNVLRGDLSLIGPRPITTEEIERYGQSRYHLLALKPGVTGLWQVSGRSDISYMERVQLDVSYAENWSFGMDLRILARTPKAVLAKRGAV
jgi:exopolysaccharide biosynthesis polyprenyl glycosylphosphotransferase